MFTKFLPKNSLKAYYMNKPKTQKYICMEDKKSKSKVSKTKLQKNAKVMDYNHGHGGHDDQLEMKQPLVPNIEFIERIDVNNDNYSNNNEEKTVNTTVRVKVLMTKDEAAKLLAKRKKEGTLDFKDVVNELVNIPAQRVISVVTLTANSKDIGLSSIFEEDEPVQG